MAWHRIIVFFRKLFPVLPLALVCGACEEVIDVKLNNENPKIVIESFITNVNNPFIVKITKSQEFFDQSNFSSVGNATVQLEYLSMKDILTEKGGGYYVSAKTKGVPGRAYTLNVTAAGQTFAATVELPNPVPIDTVYFQPGLFRSDSLNIFVGFRDPARTENYYRIRLYRNRRYAVNDYFLMTDAFSNGEKIVAPIYYRYFAPGDSVTVELLNLDRSTWKYFKGMSESIQQGVNSQAPGNPPTNFTGGALGIFGAWASSSYRSVVPKSALKK
ncbi:MAG TPA: DUF4249 domain-containing protein, partial [Prolixibacteraceae bacterium]|jgi:hypothetical protein